MYSVCRLFPGAPARRFLWKLLPMLALISLSASAWAAGQKIGQVSLADQVPNPVNPGSSTTFPATLTRNNNNGSTGSFVATLTYDGFRTSPTGTTYVPGISFVSPPSSISFTPKQSTLPFTINVSVASTVVPGTYWFTVTASRVGTSKDSYSAIFPINVGYTKHGPTAVADSGYATSGLAIKIPVLANDIPDPNIVPAKALYVTKIAGVAVTPGSTVVLTNASVTLNSDYTLTYTPAANLVPGADQFSYTMTEVGDDTPTNNYSSTNIVTVTVGTFPRVTVNPEVVTTCGPVTLTAMATGGVTPSVYIYMWTDSSGKVVRTSSATSGTDSYTAPGPGVYAVTATDSTGNQSAADFSDVTFDTTGPIITCPANIVQGTDPGLCTAVVNTGTATATDNCSSVAISGSRSDGQLLSAPYPVGTTTITWKAIDGSGLMATCPQTVTVKDMEAPKITCPADVTVSTDKGQCSASHVTLGTPTTSDNCSGAVSLSNDAPATFPKGTTTVTWTATDAAGNKATCQQKVTVNDTEAPTITCPPDVTVSTDKGLCTASNVSLGTPTTSDNCSGAVSLSNDAPSTFPKGTTTVTWTATDAAGNKATCTQKVIVNDTEAPKITCPGDVTVSTDKGLCTASNVSLGTPTTSDNCSGAINLSNDAPSTFPKGTTTVTWTATDASGNQATCTQKVTVNDTEPPSITCPADVTVGTDKGQCTASNVALGTPTTSDNCSGAVSLSNDAPTTFPKGTTTVTWTATDASGNKATCTQKVTVNDTEAPTITCPGDITVCSPLGQSGAVVTFGDATVHDNCPGVSFAGYDMPSGSTFPMGITKVTGKAIDAAGNMATCSFTVTVMPNLTVTITPSDSCSPTMTLAASAGTSYTYAWTGPDGKPAGTTQSISATTAGTYSVVVTDAASGCQGSASITLEPALHVKPD